jgi:hypothetical protein
MRNASRLLPLLLAPLVLTSCISYSVGTTARPIPKGEFHPNLAVYWVPNGIEDSGDDEEESVSLAYGSAEFEGRWGLTDRSDIALRVPPAGMIVTYKLLLNGPNDPSRTAIASIVGTGLVNGGNHQFFEAGLIASGAEDGAVPYGGVRAMHVVPIMKGAVRDTPTAGFFGGVRIRLNANFSISPEVGVYYDESALELRTRDVIVIPAITFHWR